MANAVTVLSPPTVIQTKSRNNLRRMENPNSRRPPIFRASLRTGPRNNFTFSDPEYSAKTACSRGVADSTLRQVQFRGREQAIAGTTVPFLTTRH